MLEQIGEIVLKKVKAHGLVISRVPDHTRSEFIEYADAEFAGDYGMLLAWCFKQAIEYQEFKNFLFKNRKIIIKLEKKDEK